MPEPGRRRVVDGALFGLYEDDEPERRVPVVALVVLLVSALVVGFLVWRAVNTDADLEVPVEEQAEAPTTEPAPAPEERPTVEELRLLLPAGVDGCAPPPEESTDGPPRAVLRCAGPGVPEMIDFSLFGTIADRDAVFDFLAALLQVPDGGGDCALGRPGRHDYVGVEQVGQLACQSLGGRTDLVWTSDVGPVMAVATGNGSYAEQYRWWVDLVDRTDAPFPTGEERALLERLPDVLRGDCDRDADLRLAADGVVAVTCRPERSPAGAVSWISFARQADLATWFERRRARLGDLRVADGDGACSPGGFGQPEIDVGVDDDPAGAEPPAPQAGDTTYELGGRSGSVLCHHDSAGRAVVTWVRDGERLGSVAVGADGVAMRDLLAWWQLGGHLP